MQLKVWGNEYRTTMVCIDSYENSVPTGRLLNPSLESGRSFTSLVGFLREMDALLDSMKLPQSFSAARSFQKSISGSGGRSQPVQESSQGKLATFAVRIIFRQNASWQGSVTWLEGEQEESFRSALELVLLMDSALRGGTS